MSLKSARKAAGYKIKDVATIMRISESAVCNWEKGKAMPTADKLLPLAKLYGVSVEELLRKDEGDK